MKIVIQCKYGTFETLSASFNEEEKEELLLMVEQLMKGKVEMFKFENNGKNYFFSKQMLLDSVITVEE